MLSTQDRITDLNNKFKTLFQETYTAIREYISTPKEITSISTYLTDLSKMALDCYEYEAKEEHTVEEKKEFNKIRYRELLEEHYEESYANPEWCVKLFGKEYGAILANFYASSRFYYVYAFEHKRYKMAQNNQVLIELIALLSNDTPTKEELIDVTTKLPRTPQKEDIQCNVMSMFDPTATNHRGIVMDSDLSNSDYLYSYNEFITDNEVQMAEFFFNYPQEKIDVAAEAIVNAYLRCFELEKKDLTTKKTVEIYYSIGQERLIRAVISFLETKGLTAILNYAASTPANRQYFYDHRFGFSLYFSTDLSDQLLTLKEEAYKEFSAKLTEHSGSICLEQFGELPFSPVSKDECLKLDDNQQQIMQEFSTRSRELRNRYIPRSETSFCCVAFPSPEIGKQFPEIFEDTMEINMLDSLHYESLQQKLIDILDTAEFVHVKGKDNNRTDITVKMQELKDPSQHSNFLNCGANVNIPVGEVFTSPSLTGTNGTLHISEAYLCGLKFIDLEITIVDGIAVDYSCKNFENDEENKNFIQENIMFPHETLPIGEFAIGTNTLAYVMAKKYDILNQMPVLIVEKMGPHFALGDTCFSWEEDRKIFNPTDGKEVTARDNERSFLRKEDVQKAYTGRHTDITLPYEELDFIRAITHEGKEIDIIADGRFAVPGTEELNSPLENFSSK